MSEQSKPTWASTLCPVGLHYYSGVVDDAEELLERHKVATRSSFGTRTSTKTQATLGLNKENNCMISTNKVQK